MSKTKTKWIEDAAVTKAKLNTDVAGAGISGGAGTALSSDMATGMMMGWEDTSQYNLAFTDGTRTLDITAVSGSYKYYIGGVEYTDTSDSIVIPDTEGIHMIYFNDSGVISQIANPTAAQIENAIFSYALISFVYWDATNDECIYLGYESHTYKMDPPTHINTHLTRGGQYISGNGATNVVADGDGSSNTHAQFGIASGEMLDEDVPTSSPTVGSTTGLPIYHLEGSEASPNVRLVTNSGYSVRTTGTGRLAYNQLSGGT